MQILIALLINLVPAASVVVFGWSAFTLLLLYWMENLIIGAINVLKIGIAAGSTGGEAPKVSIFLIPFFIFHYGLFCAIHGLFIYALFADRAAMAVSPENDLLALPSVVLARLSTDRFLAYNAALLAAYHVFSFLIFWIGKGAWRQAEPFSQMFEPYGRVVVVHLTILIAGMPVVLLGQPLIAVMILALIKTGMEVGVLRFGADIEESKGKLAEQARKNFKERGGS
jgi:uncharacterized protein DUF6498